MWVVIQGIGVADSVWNAALNYLYSGGIIIVQNYAGNNLVSTGPMVSKSAQLLRSLTCVEMFQQELSTYISTQTGPNQLTPPPDFVGAIIAAINSADPSGGTSSVQFPQSNYYATNGVCGSVSWDSVWKDLPSAMQSDPSTLAQWKGDKSRGIALSQTISTLEPFARSIASNFLESNPVALGQLTSSNSWGGPNGAPYLIQGSLLGDAAASYFGTMSTAMQAMAQGADNSKLLANWIQGPNGAQAQGWVMAGAYYFNIVNSNQKVADVTSGSLPTIQEPGADLTSVTGITNYLGGKTSPYTTNLQTLINGQTGTAQNPLPSSSSDIVVTASGPFISGAKAFGAALTFGSSNVVAVISSHETTIGSVGASGQALADSMNGVLDGIGTWLSTIANGQTNNANPVISLAIFGGNLTNSAYNSILMLAMLGFGLTFALGLIPYDSIGNAGISIVTAITGFYTPIYVTILTFGLTMTYYIPLIPFIIFTFGVIGWFIAVAEAMLAAPLVALGISHPEGSHPILGKADPAVALLVNVFLRPTFMVLGLLFGMMISYIGVWLVNQGFGQAYAAALKSAGNTNVAFASVTFMIVYVLIVMQVVQKSFSLIHVIPDQVMRWLGMNIEGMGGEAEAEGAIGGKARAGLGKMASMTGSTVQTAEALGKASAQLAKSGKKSGGGGA